jgi:presenilin-like A22 family membrane protease
MKTRFPILGMLAIFLGVQFVALLLVPLFPSNYQAFSNPNSPINPLVYIFLLIVMTAIILVLIKYGLGKVIKVIFLVAVFISLSFVLLPLIFLVIPDINAALVGAIVVAGLLDGMLIIKPEWYIVNIVGFVVGCGAAVILGISLGILPALLLLSILAVYDAISVYKTKHMVALAEGVVPLNLPVLFVIPKRRNFKMAELNEKPLTEDGEERDAMFMGVGDAVIPTVLVVSASAWLAPHSHYFADGANELVAFGTMIGSVLGFILLMRQVMNGKPQAGLPFLNGFAIAGYLLTYIIVYGELSFGIM